MMPVQDDARIRRQGRMALLIHELGLLPGDYRPGEEELGRAKELLTTLGAAVRKWEPSEAALADAAAREDIEALKGEIDQWNTTYAAAVDEIAALTVKVKDLEGQLAAAKKGGKDKG